MTQTNLLGDGRKKLGIDPEYSKEVARRLSEYYRTHPDEPADNPAPDQKPAGKPGVSPASAVPPVTAISTAPIELENIVLYDLKGKPYRDYKKIILDGEAAKMADGSYFIANQDDSLAYHRQRGSDYGVPSTALYAAILREMNRINHHSLAGLVKDLTESWLVTSTRIDYAKNQVVHGFGFDPYIIKVLLPESGWMKKREYRQVVQAFLGVKESETASVLAELELVSGKPAYLWTPNAESRKNVSLRAAGLYFDYGVFLVNGDANFYNTGRSRGVRRE